MEPRSTRSDITGALAAGTIVAAFCFLLLWHDRLVFWNDDYELSILPVFADVARSWSHGHWPLLSPYSWVCGNLAGEYQYGTFSLFVNAAVILIWKFPLSFPQQAAALSILHLFVFAAGAFLLGRNRHLSVALSIFVALVASLSGWMVCWGATDWFGALGAFTWLPWAWWGLERAAPAPPRGDALVALPANSRWKFLWPAPFVYLVATGGFPYTVVMLAVLTAWICLRSLVRTRSLWSIWPVVFGAALGIGLSAPALLALLEYVRESAREIQAASAHWQWVVPLSGLPALILPCWTVNWADFGSRYLPHTGTELACGPVAPAAFIAGLIAAPRVVWRKLGWETGLLLVVLAIAMLPSAGLFRWSFRWLPFFHLILAVCAGEVLGGIGFSPSQRLLRAGGQPMNRSGLFAPCCGLTALFLTGVTTIAMAVCNTNGHYAFPLTWILLTMAAIWAASDFWIGRGGSLFLLHDWTPAVITFASLLATYLCIPTNCGVPRYHLSQQLLEPAPLDRSRLYLSVYPPPEVAYRVEAKPWPIGQTVRPGSTSMWAQLRFINGYSPIRPAGVATRFNFATHGEIDWETGKYLVTHEAGPDGELARLGVDGIILAGEVDFNPLPQSEWQLVASTDEGRVFHRRGPPLARVRSMASLPLRPNERFGSAIISGIRDSRNRVEANIEVPNELGPALVGFSRPYFPGYRARIGGKELTVGSYRGLFPLIEVPGGTAGHLVLCYRPPWLIWGGGLSIACAALWAVGAVLSWRESADPTK
jgi:hypothetical protein